MYVMRYYVCIYMVMIVNLIVDKLVLFGKFKCIVFIVVIVLGVVVVVVGGMYVFLGKVGVGYVSVFVELVLLVVLVFFLFDLLIVNLQFDDGVQYYLCVGLLLKFMDLKVQE